jgi:hypothetical protein
MAAKGGGNYRDASSGRYVSQSHGRAHPSTTVREAPGPSGSSGPHFRSAETGRYVTEGFAARHSSTTVREK